MSRDLRQGRYCPVCYQPARMTRHGMVSPHWDTAGNKCEGDRLPYRVAIALDRNKKARFVA